MKSKEELEALKVECDNLKKKFFELTPEEFLQISGGCEEGENCPNGVIESEFPNKEHCYGCWAHMDFNHGVYHYCSLTKWFKG